MTVSRCLAVSLIDYHLSTAAFPEKQLGGANQATEWHFL